MKKFPPHLPAPFCNIKDHQSMQRLKIILSAALFGLVAGLSGAAMMLGWIWPGIGNGNLWTLSQLVGINTHSQLDEQVRSEKVDRRLVEVYATARSFGSSALLNPADKLGDAMIVGSDGWLAMYYPTGIGNWKNWQILLSDGAVSRLSDALFDRYSGLVYLKLASNKKKGQDSIQLNDLVDYRESNLKPGNDIFIYQKGDWYHGLITYAVHGASSLPHLDTAPNLFYALDGNYTVGAIAINPQGRVVGVVTEKNLLLPISYMANVLPQVLSEQKITYATLGIEGWFSTEEPIISGSQRIDGFGVSRVFFGTILRKGDVIAQINGEIVDMDKMWYNKDQVLKLRVWRNGKFLDLDVKAKET